MQTKTLEPKWLEPKCVFVYVEFFCLEGLRLGVGASHSAQCSGEFVFA